MNVLIDEIVRFRKWAQNNPARGGEWECNYPSWNEIYVLFRQEILHGTNLDDYLDDICYIIARDNEVEYLADVMLERETVFLQLCEYSLTTEEYDAMWQLATRVLSTSISREAMEKLLLAFYNIAHEYVSRRALLELAKIQFSKIEELCDKSWSTNTEYQRIAVLTVLSDISSPKLALYLQAAERDGREIVMNCVDRIRREHNMISLR